MSLRRPLLASLVVVSIAGLSTACVRGVDLPTTGTTPPALGDGVARGLEYKEQLEKALKARRPTDFQFIAKVIRQVETGRLPRKVVDQTLSYARDRSREYPFIYFQFALRKQAEKLGVVL